MFNEKACKGCGGIKLFCGLPNKIEGEICPCVDCLLKSVCKSGCEKYLKYIRKVPIEVIDNVMVVQYSYEDCFLESKFYLVDIKAAHIHNGDLSKSKV